MAGGDKLQPAEQSPAKIALDTRNRLQDRELYFRGRRLFEGMCVHCHGATGRGNGPWATTMTTKPRNLRMGIFKFRTTPYGKLPADSDLRRTIRSGISGTAMPAFTKMSAAELDGVIVYIQNLSQRWRNIDAFAKPLTLPEQPAWMAEDSVSAEHAASGKTLFSQTCISCHGENGTGNGPAAAGLIDVWKSPITPAALTDPHLKSGDRPRDLYRTIATGLDGTPMLGFASALNPEQIWDLVEFIRSLRSPTE